MYYFETVLTINRNVGEKKTEGIPCHFFTSFHWFVVAFSLVFTQRNLALYWDYFAPL